MFEEVFSEIDNLSKGFSEFNREAKIVLGQLLNSGVPLDMVTTFLAKTRKAERAVIEEEVELVKDRRRCKWWNNGFCREKDGCSFSHPRADSQDDCWLHCKICKYKCKFKTTFRKHMNTKPNLSCEG